MKEEYLNFLKCFSIFFIGLAVATETGKILGIAAALGLIACILDRNRFVNLKSKVFNATIALFLVYVGTISVIAIVQYNWQGLRMIMRDFEKIVSFLIIYIFIGDVKNAFVYGATGAIIGYFFGEITVFYDVFYGVSEYGNRYGGMYGNPNGLGSILELATPFIIFSAYKLRDRCMLFYFSIAALMCIVPCLLFSGSRGAMMAVGTELIILAAIIYLRKKNIKSFKPYILGVGLFIAVGIVVFASMYGRSYDSERVLLWISSWHMFLDYPILGVGFGNWAEYYKASYISPLAKEPWLPNPHNLYLYLLSETGIVGFVSYLVMNLGMLRIAAKSSAKMFTYEKHVFNIADMYIIVMCGVLVHNLVDTSAIFRYCLLILFFYWGLFCIELRNYSDRI